MRNRKLMSFIFATLILLVSCTGGGHYGLDDEKEIANAKFAEIVEAIEGKDREKLKNTFSNKALNEATDIENEIDYLFDLIKGDDISWEHSKWLSNGSVRDGKKSSMIVAWYKLTTSEDSYLFFIIYYNIDEIEPDNKGLYSLRAIKEVDRETEFTYWQDMEIPGIYIPE